MLILIELSYYVIYKLEHPFFEQYKISDDPWPWQKDKEAWRKLFWESVIRVGINNLVFTPVVLFIQLYLQGWKVHQRMDVESLPDGLTLLVTVIFCAICEDATFHCSHRFLHQRWIYPYIHKIHHKHQNSVCIASENAHPIEFMIGNVVPVLMGPLILGNKIHFFSTLTWITVRILESHDAHCGYEFPWSPTRLIPF